MEIIIIYFIYIMIPMMLGKCVCAGLCLCAAAATGIALNHIYSNRTLDDSKPKIDSMV
jgi:hypothetical protein